MQAPPPIEPSFDAESVREAYAAARDESYN
jgi:hypothetical protein